MALGLDCLSLPLVLLAAQRSSLQVVKIFLVLLNFFAGFDVCWRVKALLEGETMTNKLAIVAVLLGCQAVTTSAVFAYGGYDRGSSLFLQSPTIKIAQGDMGAGAGPEVAPDSSEAQAQAPVKHRRSHGRGGIKRKHGSKGQFKRRLSSRVKPKSASEPGGNSCCVSPSSGM